MIDKISLEIILQDIIHYLSGDLDVLTEKQLKYKIATTKSLVDTFIKVYCQ